MIVNHLFFIWHLIHFAITMAAIYLEVNSKIIIILLYLIFGLPNKKMSLKVNHVFVKNLIF
jgi:hypothetical protein